MKNDSYLAKLRCRTVNLRPNDTGTKGQRRALAHHPVRLDRFRSMPEAIYDPRCRDIVWKLSCFRSTRQSRRQLDDNARCVLIDWPLNSLNCLYELITSSASSQQRCMSDRKNRSQDRGGPAGHFRTSLLCTISTSCTNHTDDVAAAVYYLLE